MNCSRCHKPLTAHQIDDLQLCDACVEQLNNEAEAAVVEADRICALVDFALGMAGKKTGAA